MKLVIQLNTATTTALFTSGVGYQDLVLITKLAHITATVAMFIATIAMEHVVFNCKVDILSPIGYIWSGKADNALEKSRFISFQNICVLINLILASSEIPSDEGLSICILKIGKIPFCLMVPILIASDYGSGTRPSF